MYLKWMWIKWMNVGNVYMSGVSCVCVVGVWIICVCVLCLYVCLYVLFLWIVLDVGRWDLIFFLSKVSINIFCRCVHLQNPIYRQNKSSHSMTLAFFVYFCLLLSLNHWKCPRKYLWESYKNLLVYPVLQ